MEEDDSNTRGSFGISTLNTVESGPYTCNDSVNVSSSTEDENDFIRMERYVAILDGHFFKIVEEDDSDPNKITALCLKCKPKEVKIKGCRKSTSNFVSHLKRRHGKDGSFEEYQNYKKRKTNSKPQVSNVEKRSRKKIHVTRETLDENITQFIMHSMIPLKVVENPYFLQLINSLTGFNTELKVISRRQLSNRVDDLFQKYIFNIKQELKNVSYVCTTADIWSSRKRSFFGMTAHWITNECKRKSTALACQRIKGTHSFDKIAEIVEEIHLKYSLTWNKVVGTVTDNGSNFVKAFEMYGIKTSILDFEIEEENMSDSESMSDSASESDESLRTWTEKLPNHIRCGSHTLNLCASADVKKTLNKNPALLNIHNQVLGKCNKLWKAAQRPKSAEIIEKSIGHTLTRPGETRWNSLYNALQQIMEIREKCGQLFKELGLKNSLNDREFEYIQEHLKCTKPVSEALDILQGEKNTFYGILIPTLLILKRKLENLQREQWIYCQPLVDSLLNSVTSRFEDIFNFSSQRSETAVIAALTLPRFKNKWFSLVDIRHHERILYLLKRIVAQELSLSLQTTLSNQIASSRSKEDEFFDFGDQDDSQSTQTWVPMGDLEIFHYLGDPDSQISCLEKYPTIKKVFLKYNTLIPSSAPVERLFSFATMINTAKSHRLSDTMFGKRVLLKAFLNKNVPNKNDNDNNYF